MPRTCRRITPGLMSLLVDTSEQLGYDFADIPSRLTYKVLPWNLDTADYAVDPGHPAAWFSDLARIAIVERKTLSDLYGTATAGRERFERELERMTAYGFRALVIEAEWSQILNPNAWLSHPTAMRPRAMLASLLAWQQRYGVQVVACPGRRAAERITFRILERWFRDHAEPQRSVE